MVGETVGAERVGGPGAGVPQPGSDAVTGGGADAVTAPVGAFRGWLASVDVGGLSDRERVDLVAELERVKGSVCAVQARATDAYRCSREGVAPRDVARSVGSEVALARRESPSLGDRLVGLSRALVHADAPIVHADHTIPVRSGGRTRWDNGDGRCARCNQAKEAPGWAVQVVHPGPTVATDAGVPDAAASPRPREIEVTTPTGRTYRSQAPPLTGWGWQPTRPPKRELTASPLERHLIGLLAAA